MRREDFVFWLEERALLHHVDTAALARVEYVLLHLIELGGDHLDALMDAAHVASPSQARALAESRRLLRSALASLYFVNVSTLLSPVSDAPEVFTLVPARVDALTARLEFLRAQFPVSATPHALLLALARVPSTVAPLCVRTQHGALVSLEDALAPVLAPYRSTPPAPLSSLRVVALRRVAHLDAAGHVNYAAVLDTLAALFEHQVRLHVLSHSLCLMPRCVVARAPRRRGRGRRVRRSASPRLSCRARTSPQLARHHTRRLRGLPRRAHDAAGAAWSARVAAVLRRCCACVLCAAVPRTKAARSRAARLILSLLRALLTLPQPQRAPRALHARVRAAASLTHVAVRARL